MVRFSNQLDKDNYEQQCNFARDMFRTIEEKTSQKHGIKKVSLFPNVTKNHSSQLITNE